MPIWAGWCADWPTSKIDFDQVKDLQKDTDS